LSAVLLLAACSSNIPVEQIQSFSDAYKSATDAGQPILDDLAIAEKSQGQALAEARAGHTPPGTAVSANSVTDAAGCPQGEQSWGATGKDTGFIQGYCVADAPYFASLGDPPATRKFRGGLSVLGKYVDVLVALAEGRNIEELHAQLQSLSSGINQLLALVPSAAAAGPAIGGALTALKPLIDAAAKQANAEEIKRLVTEGAPSANLLIEKLKEATPSIFNTLTEVAAENATSPAGLEHPEMAKSEVARIEAYRVTVSNFVVLLDGLETALNKLVVAVQNPDNSASLQSLAEETANLRIYADAVRKAFAAVHQGG
jgi:hypothetical protein